MRRSPSESIDRARHDVEANAEFQSRTIHDIDRGIVQVLNDQYYAGIVEQRADDLVVEFDQDVAAGPRLASPRATETRGAA